MSIHKVKKQLEEQLARSQAKIREEARKAQTLGAKLSNAGRQIDTRRKILVGSWALEKASRSEEFNATMARELDRVWLSRDDDRALFDLPPLSEDEKTRREIAAGKSARKAAKQAGKDASPTNPDVRDADTADAA